MSQTGQLDNGSSSISHANLWYCTGSTVSAQMANRQVKVEFGSVSLHKWADAVLQAVGGISCDVTANLIN